jgi:hypothetical protein
MSMVQVDLIRRCQLGQATRWPDRPRLRVLRTQALLAMSGLLGSTVAAVSGSTGVGVGIRDALRPAEC